MSSFIGTKPNQVPTNGDLGRLAYLDYIGVDDVGATVPTVSSANTINIFTQITFVDGAEVVSIIRPPVTIINGGFITLIPLGKFTVNNTGNVTVSISAEVGKPIYLTYAVNNGIGLWYPSYSTTLNRLTVTAPATGSTLTIIDNKTLTVNNTITIAGTDNKTLTINNSITLNADTDGRTLTLDANLEFKTSDGNPAVVTFPAGSGTVPYTVSAVFTSATALPAVTATGTGSGGGLTATSSTATAAITATSSYTTPLAISATGDIVATGNVTAYSLSDKTLKENIVPISDPINKLLKLSGNTFKWADEFYETQHQDLVKQFDVGVIAQEVQQVLPEAVNTRDNGKLAVDYTKLIPLLIECIKAQQVEINELKGR